MSSRSSDPGGAPVVLEGDEGPASSPGATFLPDDDRALRATEFVRRVVPELLSPGAGPAEIDGLLHLAAAGRRHVQDLATDGADASAARLLARVDLSALEAAAMDVATLSPELELSRDDAEPAVAAGLRAALEARDTVELVLQGALRLTGKTAALDDDQWAHVGAFEAVVRPVLFRLVPLGAARREAVAWIAPRHRGAFWWWSAGADVPAHALDHLSTAAHLVARFPEARDELERLVRAQALLDAAALVRPEAPPEGDRALVDWILERAGATRGRDR